MTESQDGRNRIEWQNEKNWHGPKWLGLYASKNDSRTWVPKRIPWMGWTINLGKKAGLIWLAVMVAILLFACLSPILIAKRFCL